MKLSKLIAVCLLLIIEGCHWYGPPPGVGVKAEGYYEKAKPIIEALTNYYQDNGVYPDSLTKLKSKYISEYEWPKYGYKPNITSYELWFTYEGPGINSCVYTPEREWECSGLI